MPPLSDLLQYAFIATPALTFVIIYLAGRNMLSKKARCTICDRITSEYYLVVRNGKRENACGWCAKKLAPQSFYRGPIATDLNLPDAEKAGESR